MLKKSLKDLSVDHQKILMRVDLNLPLDPEGAIANDHRLQEALLTIKYLLEKDCAIILMSHLNRPKGKFESKLSLKVCAQRLNTLLNKEVKMAPDCIGEEVNTLKESLKCGEILMLENLRFHSEETNGSGEDFAKELSKGCDIFINDAFGCCHRNQASIVDVPKFFPQKAVAGLLLEKELRYFQDYILNPQKHLCAIIGGAKISTKIGVLKSLIQKVDTLLIGGAMANTFLKAQGRSLGKSLVEDEYIQAAKEILKECESKRINLVLPQDLLFTDQISSDGQTQILGINDPIEEHLIAVDMGPLTIDAFSKALEPSQIIFWNGPLGICEIKPFSYGTQKIAQKLSQINAIKVIGGGDSAAAIEKLGLQDSFDHISTGGGASIELIEKGHLPGVNALSNKD